MNRPTFEKTVDILVKAYLNHTLNHEDCQACAVGNIICGYGHTLSKENYAYTNWLRYIDIEVRGTGEDTSNYIGGYNKEVALEQINSTGYTPIQLSDIEHAFEECDRSGDRMFNGLMAVVDVLAEIHGIDLKQREEAKLLFVK